MNRVNRERQDLAADWSTVFRTVATSDEQPQPEVQSEEPATPVVELPKPSVRAAKLTQPKSIATTAAGQELPKLKGLSLRQPWAELVMNGEKTEEFRGTPTRHRGRIYIYASLGRLPADEEASLGEEYDLDIESLPRGVIVGTVEISGCELQPEGDYGWFLENPQRLDPPVPPVERPQPIWFHPFGSPDKA